MGKHVAAKPTKPAGWQPVVGGVKQACWCGKEWGEGHEDAAAHDAQNEGGSSSSDDWEYADCWHNPYK
jgi:hypothetical protein